MLEILGLPSRYTLKRKLGAGGVSVVYLAFDQERGEEVALKKLQVEITSQFSQAFTRFKREFELLASISHPNLIKTYELLETTHGEPFLTMEYVQGTSLDELIAKGELTFDQKLSIALQTARALQFIHSKGIIHRDVKPSNIIIQDNLRVKLLDFGLSRYIEEENSLTISTELVGSPQYVAPEYINRNFQKAPPDHRADVYSYGATIFELFTGRPPFHHKRSWEILGSHLCHQPPRLRELDPTLPAWLDTMLNICLNKKSEHRYQGMGEVVELVEAAGSPFNVVRNLFSARSYGRTHLSNFLRDKLSSYSEILAQVVFSLLIASLAVYLWSTPLGIALDQLQLQQIFAQRGLLAPPPEVAVVAIDNRTILELELSPRESFPRRYFVEALEQIVAAKPRLVILDLAGFKETSDEEANQRLEATLRGPVPVTILNGFLREDGSTALGDPRFRNAAAMELSMLVRSEAGTVWSLGLKPSSVSDLAGAYPLLAPLQKFARLNPAVPAPRSLINFYGPAMHIPSYSLYRFIGGPDPNLIAQIKDRIIFLGVQSLPAQGKGLVESHRDDFAVTASSQPMYGVEIHATIAANLIDQRWIRRIPLEIEWIFILCMIFGICMLFLTLPIIRGTVAAVVALIFWLSASYFAVVGWSLFVPGAFLAASVLLVALVGAGIVRSIVKERKMKGLQAKFGIEGSS